MSIKRPRKRRGSFMEPSANVLNLCPTPPAGGAGIGWGDVGWVGGGGGGGGVCGLDLKTWPGGVLIKIIIIIIIITLLFLRGRGFTNAAFGLSELLIQGADQ
jgi:hypothetical protein